MVAVGVGCCWLLLVAVGCCWLLLLLSVAVVANHQKELGMQIDRMTAAITSRKGSMKPRQ